MSGLPDAVYAVPLLVALLCLGLLWVVAEGEAMLPAPADYEPADIWALADLAGEDGIVNCTVGGEKLVEAPFSGTPCCMCRFRLTAERDTSLVLWGDVEAAGPVYLLTEGKRYRLEDFTFEGEADFGETHPLGEEPAAWGRAWPDFSARTSDVESTTWEEWRLEPDREYRFRVTELHGWFEGEVGHTVEWRIACLGPVDDGEDDD